VGSMPLGISSWSFHRDIGAGKLSILDFPYKARSLGFEDIEVVMSHLDGSAQVLKERCDDAGIKWNCVSAENNFAIPDEAARKKQIEHVRTAIDTAVDIEASVVRAFFGHVSGEPPLGIKYLTMECLKEVASYAEDRDVVIGLENHGNYCNEAIEMKEMIETIGSDHLRACPDTGNFETDVYEQLERIAPLAVHMHAKTYAFDEDGDESSLDYKRIFQIFKDSGFEGTYSLEFEGEGDETDMVEKSIALFRRYI